MRKLFVSNGDFTDLGIFLAGMFAVGMVLIAIGVTG